MTITPETVVAAAAVAAALVYFARLTRKAVHKLDAIDELTSRELNHNHGGSMKDDMHGLAVTIGQLQRDRDEERDRFNAVLVLAATHHPEAAHLYLALIDNERHPT